MDKIINWYEEFSAAFAGSGSVTQAIGAIAACGLIIGFWALLRSPRKTSPGHINRVSGSVEDLRVRVADLASKSEGLNTEVLEELKRIESRISGIEQQLQTGQHETLEGGLKKKLI